MRKLAIVTTHPIQYNAPLFKLLTERNRIGIKVFYTWGEDSMKLKFDPGFKRVVEWDIPLLNGYEYAFLNNISSDPGSHHFAGIDNPDILNSLNSWGPDALLVFGWSFKSHLKCLRYFKNKIPVLFRGDSTLLDPVGPFRSIIRGIFLRWVYQKIDIALYAGINNKNYFKKYGLKDDQLVFAPHSIDNNRFKDTKGQFENPIDLRQKLNIGKSDLVFLFAGKLEPKKDPELLLNAFITLFLPDSHLIMAGDGILYEELNRKYNQRNIHFIGFQNQSIMPLVYSTANVFVLPSKGPGETWGLSINEAMACKLPVIASDACGAAIDLIHPGKNGFIFKRENLEDLLYNLRLYAENRDKTEMWGNESLRIIADWSFEKTAAAIENSVLQ